MSDATQQAGSRRAWPLLPTSAADAQIDALEGIPLEQARLAARVSHDAAASPRRRARVDVVDVEQLQADVRAVADAAGWPAAPSSADADTVDRELGRVFVERMGVTPVDASDLRMWDFLALVALPDVALWRSRRATLRRAVDPEDHVFARLWWREYVLADAMRPPPGADALTDAELTALFRRRDLVADPAVARALARCTIASGPADDRRIERLQAALRALLHTMPIIDVDSLGPAALDALVRTSLQGGEPG
jgi:hypothetical protein